MSGEWQYDEPGVTYDQTPDLTYDGGFLSVIIEWIIHARRRKCR